VTDSEHLVINTLDAFSPSDRELINIDLENTRIHILPPVLAPPNGSVNLLLAIETVVRPFTQFCTGRSCTHHSSSTLSGGGNCSESNVLWRRVTPYSPTIGSIASTRDAFNHNITPPTIYF
jgi:hypothetical protein